MAIQPFVPVTTLTIYPSISSQLYRQSCLTIVAVPAVGKLTAFRCLPSKASPAKQGKCQGCIDVLSLDRQSIQNKQCPYNQNHRTGGGSLVRSDLSPAFQVSDAAPSFLPLLPESAASFRRPHSFSRPACAQTHLLVPSNAVFCTPSSTELR